MPPANVILENARVARENLARRHTANERRIENSPTYSVGELVRISTSKPAFAKAYERGWSKEISTHRIPI